MSIGQHAARNHGFINDGTHAQRHIYPVLKQIHATFGGEDADLNFRGVALKRVEQSPPRFKPWRQRWPQHAPAMVGCAAVRAAYQNVFDTIKLNIAFTTHDIEIHGDTAWARTSSAGRTRIIAAGIEVDEGNNELFVFRQESGVWKIHRYIFCTTQPRA